VSAVATRVIRFVDGEDPADARDDHPLTYRYQGASRVVSLDSSPRWFHAHVPSGFYLRETVERRGVRFDERLRVAFDDATFAAEYLLGEEAPTLLVVPDAEYVYRIRADTGGHISSMWSKRDKYVVVPDLGWLRLLRTRTPPPLWLQSLVLYDLEWFFYEYELPDSPARQVAPETAAALPHAARRDPRAARRARPVRLPAPPVSLRVRAALAARKTGRLLRPEAWVVSVDAERRLARIAYHSLSATPAELLTVDARPRAALSRAHRPVTYYGQTFLHEHELEVHADGVVMLEVDGEQLPLTLGEPGCGALFPWQLPGPPVVAGPPPEEACAPPPLRARAERVLRDPRRVGPAVAWRVRRLADAARHR
jgi:hypothetical protein